MLETIDWTIIITYFVISIGIGIYLSKRASKNTGNFFLGGRNLPWYIAGTSMVATTFAADTPLAVTELVSTKGIAGNWLWWNMLIGGMLTVFFFAKLWRRAGIMTDCEFVAIRYSGPVANFLRGFRAFYIGIFMNVVVLAWVNLAMVKILTVLFPEFTLFGIEEWVIIQPNGEYEGFIISSHLMLVGILMLFVGIYTSLAGLLGISFTDSFQFIMAMTGCIALAIFAVNHESIGGMSGLMEKLPAEVFSFFPSVGEGGETAGVLQLSLMAFVAYLGVQWWASWYPGAEPGGGGYIAQRMMSAKDEKHSLFATLWFTIAHFAVRPWPWIVAALCAMVMYPELPADQKGEGFVMLIGDVLPAGLVGLLVAAFFAAYMSTIASQTIWGTSYIVNDFYKPFINKNADEKKYVTVSRITTFGLLILSILVTTQFSTIKGAWEFILECSAGIGLVLILRWFWWRVNAWSEIAAIVTPFLILIIDTILYNKGLTESKLLFPNSLYTIVGITTVVWLTVTFLTKPTDEEKLISFYKKVRPGGIGWKKYAEKMPDSVSDEKYPYLFFAWLLGCVLVMTFLFGTGKLIFGEIGLGTILLLISIGSGYLIWHFMNKGKIKLG